MKKNSAALADAQVKQQLIILYRKSIDNSRLDGYVAALSDSWVLLHLVDGSVLTFNGYHAVRLKDISSFNIDEGFVGEYLRLRGMYPKKLPQIDLQDLPVLLRSVADNFSLLMIEREKVEPGIGLIGVIKKLTKRNLCLEKFNSKAKWIGTERFKLKDITAVSFGDGYVEALAWMDAHSETPTAADLQEDT